MNAAQQKTKRSLEATLSIVAGFEVELTIRGLKEFTISAEGCKDWAKLLKWFESGKVYKLESHSTSYDADCDYSCFFFTVA